MSSAWRTTEAAVAAILPAGTVGTDLSVLDPSIDIANLLVTDVVAPEPDTDATSPTQLTRYSAARLEHIERVLAAHYYVSFNDPTVNVTSERAGDTAQTFGGVKAGQSTRYWEEAIALDYLGKLASIRKRVDDGENPQPGAIWFGTPRGHRHGGCS